MKLIELSSYKVEIKDAITWGDQEAIRATMLGGVKMSSNTNVGQNVDFDASSLLSAKYKALEVCIVKITDQEGKHIAYTKDWMNNLSIEDGDVLYSEVEAVTNPVKK